MLGGRGRGRLEYVMIRGTCYYFGYFFGGAPGFLGTFWGAPGFLGTFWGYSRIFRYHFFGKI